MRRKNPWKVVQIDISYKNVNAKVFINIFVKYVSQTNENVFQNNMCMNNYPT